MTEFESNMHPVPDLPSRVLVVDDEKNIRTTLSVCLEGIGCRVTAVASAESALEAVDRAPFDLVFLDLRLEDGDGLDVLVRMLAARPALPVVIVTAHASFDSAVEAIKRGAIDYLPKPFSPAQVRHIAQQAQRRRALSGRMLELADRLAEEVPEIDLASESPAMQSVLDLLSRAAPSDAPILLRGENGTGKGVLARAIHAQSARATRPFVTVNCPTLSEDLLASELFGHVRGAFTGAVRDQAGRVDAAEGGTLFLDEVGEISTGLQAKLLRFVQEKKFERVGDNRTRTADVRIVAATNRDLAADVREGRFREDLLFRLNVLEIRVPPLRERREDIVRLARSFLAFFARKAGRPAPQIAADTEAVLETYEWPGNVRELRNAMERAVILWPSPIVVPHALPEQVAPRPQAPPKPGDDVTLEELERQHILRVLERTSSMEEAAQILGIDASTLWRKRKKYGP